MTIQTSSTRLGLTASVVFSTFIAASVAASPGPPLTAKPSDADERLTASLSVLAQTFGDSTGRIVSRDDPDTPMVLAVDRGDGHQLYMGGDQVQASDVFAYCHEDGTGGLSSCEPLPPGADEYDCDYDEQESWCTCAGFGDCFFLAMEMCTEPIECDPDLICVCNV